MKNLPLEALSGRPKKVNENEICVKIKTETKPEHLLKNEFNCTFDIVNFERTSQQIFGNDNSKAKLMT